MTDRKSKRSTSKPRAGTKRTARRQATPAPRPEIVIGAANTVVGTREPNRDRAHRWRRTYRTRQQLADDVPSETYPHKLEEMHPAALEQFEAARQAAFAILDSGAMGSGEVVTIISGQGNTDHTPTNGQPNDAITVVLRQVGS